MICVRGAEPLLKTFMSVGLAAGRAAAPLVCALRHHQPVETPSADAERHGAVGGRHPAAHWRRDGRRLSCNEAGSLRRSLARPRRLFWMAGDRGCGCEPAFSSSIMHYSSNALFGVRSTRCGCSSYFLSCSPHWQHGNSRPREHVSPLRSVDAMITQRTCSRVICCNRSTSM